MRSLQLFLGSFLAGPASLARWDAPLPSGMALLARVPGAPGLALRRGRVGEGALRGQRVRREVSMSPETT